MNALLVVVMETYIPLVPGSRQKGRNILPELHKVSVAIMTMSAKHTIVESGTFV